MRAPIRPIFCGSRMEVIPTTSVEKTSGTISIIMALMKMSPSGLNTLAVSPSSAPANTPSAKPARIFCHRAIRRHQPNFSCVAVSCINFLLFYNPLLVILALKRRALYHFWLIRGNMRKGHGAYPSTTKFSMVVRCHSPNSRFCLQ